MNIEVDVQGQISGCDIHDALVLEIRKASDGQIHIIYESVSGVKMVLHLFGVELCGLNLSKGDIITDIFQWDFDKLTNLHDGVWLEILNNFCKESNKESVMKYIANNLSLVQVYCATRGAASVIAEEFKCYEVLSLE